MTDHFPCHACGKMTHIDALDGKPGPGQFTAAQLSDAADRGEDFTRLECRNCYGDCYEPARG